MPQMKMMKTQDIFTEEQVRKVIDPKQQAELNASVKAHGILVPLLVMLNGMLLAGHRRLLAAKDNGLETVPVIVTDRLLSDSEVRVIQLTENMQRADLSGWDKYLGCSELMCMNQHWQMQDLAEHLGLDPSMCPRLLSPSKCTGEWQDALKAGKVKLSDTYAACKLDKKDQAALLALKLSGASRDALEQAGRKTRAAATPAVRVSRLKLPLTGGATVTVAGDSITWDEAIESLKEAVKAFTKARDTGLDGKTAQAVWRDVAKAS